MTDQSEVTLVAPKRNGGKIALIVGGVIIVLAIIGAMTNSKTSTSSSPSSSGKTQYLAWSAAAHPIVVKTYADYTAITGDLANLDQASATIDAAALAADGAHLAALSSSGNATLDAAVFDMSNALATLGSDTLDVVNNGSTPVATVGVDIRRLDAAMQRVINAEGALDGRYGV